ncbi:hypothetical protein [Methanosphaera sp.]
MVYKLIMEKDFEEKINELQRLNIKEHTQLTKKLEEMQTHAEIRLNHKTEFNTFEKPLQNYKWIEINKKILVFKIDPMKKELHLCEYLPQNEVFS